MLVYVDYRFVQEVVLHNDPRARPAEAADGRIAYIDQLVLELVQRAELGELERYGAVCELLGLHFVVPFVFGPVFKIFDRRPYRILFTLCK